MERRTFQMTGDGASEPGLDPLERSVERYAFQVTEDGACAAALDPLERQVERHAVQAPRRPIDTAYSRCLPPAHASRPAVGPRPDRRPPLHELAAERHAFQMTEDGAAGAAAHPPMRRVERHPFQMTEDGACGPVLDPLERQVERYAFQGPRLIDAG